MQRKRLLSIDVSLGNYDSFVDKLIDLATSRQSGYACVANVHMLIEAKRYNGFAELVNKAEIVTPDGMPLTWALKILYGIHQERVAGMDLLPDLLKAAERQKVPIGFYGGTEEMLKKTREKLEKKHPELIISKMYSPPFRALTPEEESNIVESFRISGAALVFVVLGCPKQEKWMASVHSKMKTMMIGIGGALPVYAGMQKRAPLWMQEYGLEWFFRLSNEPVRLFKRYAYTNSWFIYLILKEKFFLKRPLSEKNKNG